ncbi:hypothetical protein V2W30_30460 [Streptomyces sp. Q6]|uniref:Uncharacterized protein n=1 Tax=Streptomyces citrinus TaxID=3118173 RepID=A0ACD5AJ76_9ACTN
MVRVIDSRVPGFAVADRRGRWKIVTLLMVLTLVATVTTSYIQFNFNLLTMKATTRAADAAGQAVEDGKEPFTTAVSPASDVDSAVRNNRLDVRWVLFTAPLTPEEQGEILAHPLGENETMEQFLRMLDGFTHKPVLVYDGGNRTTGEHRVDFAYGMTLQSARAQAVSVRGMDAVDVTCAPSTATTVISLPPEGEEPIEEVAVDLAAGDREAPLLQQSQEDPGPYFAHQYIELGNGQTSWAALMDVLTVTDQCSWAFKVSYVHAGQQRTKVVRDDAFHTPGLPTRPRQLIEFRADNTGNRWICWGEQIAADAPCPVRAPADDADAGAPALKYWGSFPVL